MSKDNVFTPPTPLPGTHVPSKAAYEDLCRQAEKDPAAFWGKRALELLEWFSPWHTVSDCDLKSGKISWYLGGKLNVAHNCLDRHLAAGSGNKTAILWEGDSEGESRAVTYAELHAEVCRFANVLKSFGLKKGDRACLYLPMIPETAVAMLACARLGIAHAVVFAGFSSSSLADRINDCGAGILITADCVPRAGKKIPLKANADEALASCPSVKKVVVVNRGDLETPMTAGRDVWWHEAMAAPGLDAPCPAEHMDAEDMLFLLYTSGSTGKPKGVVHTTGGYLTYAAHTTQIVFDIQDEDIYWCTADVGWITGHSYLIYGPLALGATTLMFEGVPNWPQPDRYWKIVEKYKVNILYTAPTVIRALMREGSSWPKGCDLSSLRILGSVGEPINPEAWLWYHKHIGGNKAPIADTWWQTETGGILIAPLPYAADLKPGSAGRPLPGISAAVLHADGSPAPRGENGHLVITAPWPGMFRGLYKDPERFISSYMERFPGAYQTGDGAACDADGDFWITGRLDDVINVSGHRMSTAELESVLSAHRDVAEAAVVGMPHAIKGQAIYAYVVLQHDVQDDDSVTPRLRKWVRESIGPIATPEIIQIVDGLPKTRSGKVMRRILRLIAAGQTSDFGDTSTLADAAVVADLVEGFLNLRGE